MQFRSVDDLALAIRKNLHKLPRDIDVVVGIPRSGLLPAGLIALHLNCVLTDVEGFNAGRAFAPGATRLMPSVKLSPEQWKNVLLVDDSTFSGRAMREAKESLNLEGRNLTTCAVFGLNDPSRNVDLVFEVCAQPRIFEWNLLHHEYTESACVDFDGVLCCDPSDDENDDGERYRGFLANVAPLYRPSRKVGAIVSSRLEKYRPECVAWLERHNVQYGQLFLLDLPTGEERRRRGIHASFKAEVYKQLKDSKIFLESEPGQAAEIARLSGKAVIWTGGMVLYHESVTNKIKRKVHNTIRYRGNRLMEKIRRW